MKTRGFDTIDIVTWTNTSIVLKLPSVIIDNYGPNQYGVAGSGSVQVLPAGSTDTSAWSTQKLNLSYNLINQVEYTSGKVSAKKRVYLLRNKCINGFVFTLHKSLDTIPDAVEAIEKALEAWQSITHINLELERDAFGNIVYTTDNLADVNTVVPNRNIIAITGPSLTTSPLISTSRNFQKDLNDKYYKAGANILINPSPMRPWHFKYNDTLPALHYDFYRAIQHEIGHILLLEHTYDWDQSSGISTFTKPVYDLMFESTYNYGFDIDPTYRKEFLLEKNPDAESGAQNVVASSKLQTWNFGSATDKVTLTDDVTEILPTPSIGAIFGIKGGCPTQLYPIPQDCSLSYKWTPFLQTTCTIVPAVPGPDIYTVQIVDSECKKASLPSKGFLVD